MNMELKKGYSLVWGEPEGRGFCGDGTAVPVSLVRDGQIVAKFVTCPCGRGCGNKRRRGRMRWAFRRTICGATRNG